MTPKENEIKAAQDLQRLIFGGFRWLRRLLVVAAMISAIYEYRWETFSMPVRGSVVAIENGKFQSKFAVFEYRVENETYRGQLMAGRGRIRRTVKIGDFVDLLCRSDDPKSWCGAECRWYELPALFCFGAVVFWLVPFFAEGLSWDRLHPPMTSNGESSITK